jgi:phosphoesterase RecJ-like protein
MKQAVLDFLEREDSFLLLVHSNADPDAVGSAVALKEFLKLHNKKAQICCHNANQMARHLLKNLHETIDCKNADSSKNVIILDTASPSQLGSCKRFLKNATQVVVIDHHQDSSFLEYLDVREKDCLFLQEEKTSAAEILFDLLPERNKKINLALLSGILTDTGNFKYATADTMKTVHKILEEGVKLYEAFDMFCEQRNVPKRIAIIRGCQRSRLYKVGGHLIITSSVNSHESTAAGFLTQVVDVAFVANVKAGRIIAKAAPDMDIDLSRIMKKIGALYNGDGGGHKRAAGASGESISDALENCVELVQEYLDKKQ